MGHGRLALLAVGLLAGALPAFASLGTTQCANADGTIKRTETEVWGANQVAWTYNGAAVAEDAIGLSTDSATLVTDRVDKDPTYGDMHTVVKVVPVVFAIDKVKVSDVVLCKTVEFPGVVDFGGH